MVGHELAHGVTEHESNLFYWYQSGAINESLSDVFGEPVDLTNGRGTDTPKTRWQLGGDLPASVGVIRDMEDPTLFKDPDRMTSPLYVTDGDQSDSGGVHHNGGDNNRAASLLTDGGFFNGRTVSGLGVDKVAQLYYEVESNLLASGSDYLDLHDGLRQACVNLTGQSGITSSDCHQVTNATLAVEMNQDPPKAPAPEAPVCGSGESPSTRSSKISRARLPAGRQVAGGVRSRTTPRPAASAGRPRWVSPRTTGRSAPR